MTGLPVFKPRDVNSLQSAPPVFRLLLSVKESAAALGLSCRTVQNLISSKELPVRRIGRRVLIHRKDLEAFARRDHVCVGGE
jgi:excisionase family DNA binding protein